MRDNRLRKARMGVRVGRGTKHGAASASSLGPSPLSRSQHPTWPLYLCEPVWPTPLTPLQRVPSAPCGLARAAAPRTAQLLSPRPLPVPLQALGEIIPTTAPTAAPTHNALGMPGGLGSAFVSQPQRSHQPQPLMNAMGRQQTKTLKRDEQRRARRRAGGWEKKLISQRAWSDINGSAGWAPNGGC